MKSTALKSWRHLITGSAACTLLIGGLLFLQQTDAQRRSIANVTAPAQNGVYQPTQRKIEAATPISIAEAAKIDAGVKYNRPFAADSDGPGTRPQGMRDLGVPITRAITDSPTAITAPTPSSSGVSAPPTQTFKGEYLSGTTIPPDTMGAVGTAFVVTSTNDRLRIQDRNGNELSRVSITSFWNGTQVKGVNVGSAFDTKVLYDRFNNRFILVSSLNGPSINSGLGLAVSQTNDPTGVWNRYTIASDPASTATAGHGIDYPSVGFNKNWIVIDENVFNYTGTGFSTYYGQQIFVADKQAAYAGSLSSFSLFEGQYNAGAACSSNNTLGCGFTMAPAIVEDNTTDTVYMAEDWDDTQAQLRLSKITGTPAAPVLTIATQFPQSIQSWRGDAARIGTSGGYLPQRESFSYQGAAQRIMANDARIQNTVYRAGSLWTTHTVMLANTPTPAGTCVGGTTAGCPTDAIIDDHSGIQWWQINPTIETGLSTPPLQRGRIEDTTADNCHDGNAGTRTTGTCTSVATQVGTFFAFPNISVNQNNDVLIGFSQFSPLTHPTAAYAIRRSSDALNTMRDPIAFRDGQSRYNIGGGTANTTARQNRWGDYSAAQTDPLDDTTFWTVQEYAGTTRNFGIGLAGNWETWWANVNPATAAPSTSGNLIISEFRLRGPQGANDEYVELYNPSSTAPVYVNTTDNSDGWALAYSSDGTTITPRTVIPNGTVIPPNGHFLITRGPDNANGPTATYSLNTYPGRGQQPISGTTEAVTQRGADSDTSYDLDNADNGGFAIF
ncbi:MAG: lamin tail domain-containing protein, partial [Pyrinomonadaceae bacterium]